MFPFRDIQRGHSPLYLVFLIVKVVYVDGYQPRGTDLGTLVVLFQSGKNRLEQYSELVLTPDLSVTCIWQSRINSFYLFLSYLRDYKTFK